MRDKRYTLIELVVTLAVIMILATLLIQLMGQVKKKQKDTQCADQKRTIGYAFSDYAGDHANRLITSYGDGDDEEQGYWKEYLNKIGSGQMSDVSPVDAERYENGGSIPISYWDWVYFLDPYVGGEFFTHYGAADINRNWFKYSSDVWRCPTRDVNWDSLDPDDFQPENDSRHNTYQINPYIAKQKVRTFAQYRTPSEWVLAGCSNYEWDHENLLKKGYSESTYNDSWFPGVHGDGYQLLSLYGDGRVSKFDKVVHRSVEFDRWYLAK